MPPHFRTMQNLFIAIFRTSLLPNRRYQIIKVLEPNLTQKRQNILNDFDFTKTLHERLEFGSSLSLAANSTDTNFDMTPRYRRRDRRYETL